MNSLLPSDYGRFVEGRDATEYVVFITGALSSKRYLFDTAKNLGYRVAVMDTPCSGGGQLFESRSVDLFIPIDLSCPESESVDNCVALIRSSGMHVAGVVTFMEMAVTLTSKIAYALGLPGLSPDAARIARDKRLTRATLYASGDTHSIRSFSVNSVDDLKIAVGRVGLPAVLKPIAGADSIGVKRVNSLEGGLVAFQESRVAMGSVVINSGVLCLPPDPVLKSPLLPALEKTTTPSFLFEEYLDGPEVDVDLVMYSGECVYAAVSDNGETVEPYFTETYGVLPSRLSREAQESLEQLAVASVLVLGLESGVFHVEAKLTTSRGPRLIEINARMGGGPIWEMHKRVNGIDLAAEQIRIACGRPPKYERGIYVDRPLPLKEFAYMTTNALSSGVVGASLTFLDQIQLQYPEVIHLCCRVKSGDQIIGPEKGQPTWLVELWIEQSSSSRCDNKPYDIVERITRISDEIAKKFQDYYV